MKESWVIGIIIIVLVTVSLFVWKIQKKVEFNFITKDYVREMYEDRIVTLEREMEILKKRLDK